MDRKKYWSHAQPTFCVGKREAKEGGKGTRVALNDCIGDAWVSLVPRYAGHTCHRNKVRGMRGRRKRARGGGGGEAMRPTGK